MVVVHPSIKFILPPTTNNTFCKLIDLTKLTSGTKATIQDEVSDMACMYTPLLQKVLEKGPNTQSALTFYAVINRMSLKIQDIVHNNYPVKVIPSSKGKLPFGCNRLKRCTTYKDIHKYREVLQCIDSIYVT